MESGGEYRGDDWQQAGENADAQDLAGPGMYGRIECTVNEPHKENESTQNQYISYQINVNVGRPVT